MELMVECNFCSVLGIETPDEESQNKKHPTSLSESVQIQKLGCDRWLSSLALMGEIWSGERIVQFAEQTAPHYHVWHAAST